MRLTIFYKTAKETDTIHFGKHYEFLWYESARLAPPFRLRFCNIGRVNIYIIKFIIFIYFIKISFSQKKKYLTNRRVGTGAPAVSRVARIRGMGSVRFWNLGFVSVIFGIVTGQIYRQGGCGSDRCAVRVKNGSITKNSDKDCAMRDYMDNCRAFDLNLTDFFIKLIIYFIYIVLEIIVSIR